MRIWRLSGMAGIFPRSGRDPCHRAIWAGSVTGVVTVAAQNGRVLEPDPVITCIDCGGRAHLLTAPHVDPEDGRAQPWLPGDIVAYRCEDCLDRWDIVLEDDTE